ncbi:MAG: peptidylprolyl isomerase [Acetivibrionales bacterium]
MKKSVSKSISKSDSKKKTVHNASEEKRMMPIFVKYGLIAVAIIVAAAVGLVVYFNATGNYVAKIDGEKISTEEFRFQLDMRKQNMYYEVYMVDPSISEETFWATKIDGEDAVEVAKKLALDDLKSAKVTYKKAKDAKVELTDDEKNTINDYIEKYIDIYGDGNKIKANKALKEQYGITVDTVRKLMVENFIITKFMQQEVDKITDEQADVETHYEKNPDWYKEADYRVNGEEAVWARHILVKVDESATREEKDAARKKAGDIIEKLKAGEDFATLVKEYSEDEGSNSRGGDYVFGKDASFYEEFKDAAFSLEPGEFTQTPVETAAGYHIIKVEEKYAKDEPVGLKCAKEYYEYGTDFVKQKLYTKKVNDWVNSADYELNTAVYNSIK